MWTYVHLNEQLNIQMANKLVKKILIITEY